ncbi:hypothetical protein Bhyg_11098, partial [Pseudolycoriella hygida]
MKNVAKKEKKINELLESNKVLRRITKARSKRNSDSPLNVNLDQYIDHQPSCRPEKQLSKSCIALHNYEDGIEITSSEDNKIRIQIKYDDDSSVNTPSVEKLPSNISCDNTGVTRVTTNFNGNCHFNEKAIDVPDNFHWNA